MAMKDLSNMYGAFAYQELLQKYGIDPNKNDNQHEWENLCNSERENLTMDFIETFADKVNWRLVTRYCKLSEDFMRKYEDKVDWVEVSSYETLSDKFVDDFADRFNWSDLSQHLAMSKKMILKYIERMDWDRAPFYQKKIDEDVVEAVLASNKKDELNWHGLMCRAWYHWSEEFLEKHDEDLKKADKWDLACYYQKLSEPFLEKYGDRMNWNYISQRQELSKEFMLKHKDKLNFTWLKKHQKNFDADIQKAYGKA